ncbi:MAG: hypothetical protein A3I60_01000 [Sulfuricurvum sp. RIFCSPLOWO2_02_FULL_43_45]|nr:MAG: hypothetical protein A3I60_01000 [Sulfuricurvum sp. RIFCSPLOWO2_02_FULL_43_45]
MGKTKTTSIKLPRGSSELQTPIRTRKHFDTVNPLLAEEHYEKYLIVKNDHSGKEKHNRYYLCHEAIVEFYETSEVIPLVVENLKKNGIASTHLISLFPEQKNMIMTTLFALIGEGSSRSFVTKLITGFSHLLMILKKLKIPLKSLNEVNGNILKALVKDAKANAYSKSSLKSCTQFLRQVRSYYGNELEVPNLQQYGVAIRDNKEELSMVVSWQLDIYACKELDETIRLVKEYKEWMRDLKAIQALFTEDEIDQHGGIFTLKNLIFTYFNNIELLGKKSGKHNEIIQKAARALYGTELKVWKYQRGKSKQNREAEARLREKGEGGINITIHDERMFAIWQKVITPDFPYDRSIKPQYFFLNKSLDSWRYVISHRGIIDLTRFNRRIFPTKETIYPLYLLSLCRSGLNQQPIKDWRVWQDAQEEYQLGVDSGMGRLVDGFKGRGNTMQTTALDKQHCRYVDFFCNYITPLYKRSGNNHFFQYVAPQGSNSLSKIHTWDNLSLATMFFSKKHFFYKYSIEDTEMLPNGACQQKRIYSIEHEQIRKVKNLSEYLKGKVEWERQYELGHKKIETGIYYEQTGGFIDAKQHRIAMTLNTLLDFIRGKVSEKENPKLKVFKGPLADCQNPFKPDYNGAKPLRDGDVCTNWRKCLSGCSQCQPVKSVHGPNIMAWRIVMEELRSIYTDPQEWERMFLLDDHVAEAALNACYFTEEELFECKKKANEPRRLDFIRLEVLNSQKSRQLNHEEQANA